MASLLQVIKRIILFIWQLPQNILGLGVIYFSYARYNKIWDIWETYCKFGVSLGDFIVINHNASEREIKHEQGHQRQSRYLGPLYLIVIGLPTACGNFLRGKIKFKYYRQPWERWADYLGKVKRYYF